MQSPLSDNLIPPSDYALPACYAVQAAPPAIEKTHNFTDETLFYVFYACPGDELQLASAKELYVINQITLNDFNVEHGYQNQN